MLVRAPWPRCALLAGRARRARPRASRRRRSCRTTRSLLNDDADRRDATLDEWKALGVDIVKMRVDWRRLAPARLDDKPAVDPTDPTAYTAPD